MFAPSHLEARLLTERALALGLKSIAGLDACYCETCFQGAWDRLQAWADARDARVAFLNPRKGA